RGAIPSTLNVSASPSTSQIRLRIALLHDNHLKASIELKNKRLLVTGGLGHSIAATSGRVQPLWWGAISSIGLNAGARNTAFARCSGDDSPTLTSTYSNSGFVYLVYAVVCV